MRASRRPFIAVGWCVFVAATTHFLAWGPALVIQPDMRWYSAIARAAPGLPDGGLEQQHAERFPVHWLLGSIVNGLGVGLHTGYWIASAIVLAAVVVVLDRILRQLELGLGAYALCLGAAVASPYPFRYLLVAPALLADGVFVLGTLVALHGLLRRRDAEAGTGILLAVLARQTAVLVGPALAVAARARPLTRIALAVVPLVTYLVLREVAAGFSTSNPPRSVLGVLDEPRALADHVGRCLLPLLAPLGLLVGAALAARAPRRDAAAPLLAAAAIVVQPLVFAPSWVVHNEPRLAGLAVPAVAVAAAAMLRRVELRAVTVAVGCVAIAAASLHPRYARPSVGSTAAWAGVELAAGIALALALALRGRRPQERV